MSTFSISTKARFLNFNKNSGLFYIGPDEKWFKLRYKHNSTKFRNKFELLIPEKRNLSVCRLEKIYGFQSKSEKGTP